MASPSANNASYSTPVDQTLVVGQGEFAGRGVATRLRISARAATLSSTPVPFNATATATRLRARARAGAIDLSAITPTNLTTFTITPAITGTALPITFGHAFAPGDVPSGTSVEVFGKTTQFNPLSTHPDGSVRHAAMTALLDTSAGVTQIVTLRTRVPVSGAEITKANILASAFDASVSVVVSGTTYTLSVRSLLDGTITPLPDMTHWSGPQCASISVGGKLRNGGTPHAHLAAYFHLKAYGTSGTVTRVRCDVVVENGWTFAAGAGLITHNPTIVVGGTTVLSLTGHAHYHHTKFHGGGWWGANPQITFKHNAAYLISTGMVPNYELLTLKESLLASLNTTYTPGGNGPLRASWGDTGDHQQIGLMPEWDACYVLSGDIRALNSSIVASKSGGSFSYHYRDENTGHPVSIDTYPTMDEQNYSAGLVQGTGGNPYSHDQSADASAHAPLLGYLAFLATGDAIHLDELQFQANYLMLWRLASARTYLNGPQDGVGGLQNRGQAWFIRTLAAVAAITPDAHPLKNYFVNKLNNNIDEKTAHWASPSKNVFGHMQDYNWPTKVTPFENDFMLMTFGWLVDLGFTSATAMRDWLAKSPPGRLGQGGSGYCPYFAAPYKWDAGISPTPTGDTFYSNWVTLYQANYPVESGSACPAGLKSDSYQNVPNSGDFTNGHYSSLKAALAVAVDAGVATQNTWNQLLGYATNDYTYSSRYNLVPRSLQAFPAWYLALADNEAHVFTGLLANAIDPCPSNTCNYSGTEGFRAIMDSWSGAVYNSIAHRLDFFGGGHNAFYGNLIIGFDFYNPQWIRVTEPSSVPSSDLAPPNTTAYYADTRPSARHTYKVIQFDARRNQLISGTASATSGSSGLTAQKCDVFDYAAQTWLRKADAPAIGNENYGTVSGMDSAGNYWRIPSGFGPTAKWNPVVDVWTTYGSAYNYDGFSGTAYIAGAIDTLRDRFVIIGAGYFTKTDLATPGTTVNCGGSPPSAIFNGVAPGWVYDPVNDRFIGWAGGQTLHVVDAATLLNWSTITVTGDTLPLCTEGGYQWRGTNGKFAYMPDLHAVCGCVQTGLPPFSVKLSRP